jgi:hypothetical protein
VNGDARNRRRVTGGTIKLNGSVIAASTQLHGRMEFFTVLLGSSLLVENTLDVQVEGPAGSFVTVVVKGTKRLSAL